MSIENPGDTHEKPKSHLENILNEFPEEDQKTIDRDIFNRGDITPFSTAIEIIETEEDATSLKTLFELYIAEKNLLSKEELEARIKEISDFIDERL